MRPAKEVSMPTMHLTKRTIQSLDHPKRGQVLFRDDKRGFALRLGTRSKVYFAEGQAGQIMCSDPSHSIANVIEIEAEIVCSPPAMGTGAATDIAAMARLLWTGIEMPASEIDSTAPSETPASRA